MTRGAFVARIMEIQQHTMYDREQAHALADLFWPVVEALERATISEDPDEWISDALKALAALARTEGRTG